MSEPIGRYFTCTYPRRGALAGVFFRHGEKARLSMVQSWLSITDGLDILDAGCGDGRFLLSVLSGHPKKVRIEDVVAGNVQMARSNLLGLAETIEVAACDSFKAGASQHEVVLALGVLDYQQNWKEALSLLTARTRTVMIANLPCANHPRNLLRYLWLRCWGMRLSLVNRHELNEALHTLGLPFELQRTRLEWFVRITRK